MHLLKKKRLWSFLGKWDEKNLVCGDRIEGRCFEGCSSIFLIEKGNSANVHTILIITVAVVMESVYFRTKFCFDRTNRFKSM